MTYRQENIQNTRKIKQSSEEVHTKYNPSTDDNGK